MHVPEEKGSLNSPVLEQKTERRRLMFAIPSMDGGGAERVFLNIMNHMDPDRFEVYLAVGVTEGPLFSKLNKNIRVIRLGCRRAYQAVIPLLNAIRHVRPHYVCATLGFVVPVSFLKPFLPRRVRLVSRLGNTLGAHLRETSGWNCAKYIFYYLLHVPVLIFSDRVVVQSNHMAGDLKRLYTPLLTRNAVTIRNPVDIGEILAQSEKAADNVLAGYRWGGPHLISIGRLDRQKGFDILIIAFRHVLDRYPEATLTIFGEGSLRASLEALVCDQGMEGHVFLPGFRRNPYASLRHADLYVSSSRYEGCSNALLEALALGVPVVATDCPSGIREVLRHGENGWLIPPGEDTSTGLPRVICKALEAPPGHPSSAKNDVRTSHDVRLICNQYEALFST